MGKPGRKRVYDYAAIAAYYGTHTKAETARAFGCDRATVDRAMALGGLVKRVRRAAPGKSSTYAKVAAEFGVSPASVRSAALRVLESDAELLRGVVFDEFVGSTRSASEEPKK